MSDCDEARELLPELVLGVLGGDERAAVLAHVETCRSCQGESEALVTAAGALLELVPAADPPPGFESRLLARRRRRAGGMTPGRRLRVRLAAVAAGVVLLGAGIGIGAVAAGGGHPAEAAVSVPLVSPAGHVGEVIAAAGRKGFLAMSVDLDGRSGWVRCVAVERGGRHVALGSFLLSNGYGSWSSPLRAAATVTKAELLAPSGRILATATFTTAV